MKLPLQTNTWSVPEFPVNVEGEYQGYDHQKDACSTGNTKTHCPDL